MKVVFHVVEMEKWNLSLINVRNLLRDAQEEVEIVVVANAEAVDGYTKDFKLAHVMTKQSAKGVVFEACANAVKAHDLDKDDILDFVEIIPNSMIELIVKQQEGFAYIRP